MDTQELELLGLAEQAVETEDDRTALIVDLSDVPHIDDPTFFRTLMARVEQRTKQLDTELFRLSHHLIAVVVTPDHLEESIASIDALDDFLHEMGRGGVAFRNMPLASHSKELGRLCKSLLAERSSSRGQAADEKPFLDYVRIFNSLRSADISNLVREQTIWDLRTEHEPTVFASALTISIDMLDDIFSQRIRENPWLFEKVMEIIDIRMLDHVIVERLQQGKTLTVNMNTSVVLHGEMDRFFDAIPLSQRAQVIMEVPYVEALHDEDAFRSMVSVLRRFGFPVALDGVRWNSLSRLQIDQRGFDFVKLMWDDKLRRASAEEQDAFATALKSVGAERCIVFNCVDESGIDELLKVGVGLFQGRAVEAHNRHDREEVQHEHEREAAREELAEETEKPESLRGILGKLFN